MWFNFHIWALGRFRTKTKWNKVILLSQCSGVEIHAFWSDIRDSFIWSWIHSQIVEIYSKIVVWISSVAIRITHNELGGGALSRTMACPPPPRSLCTIRLATSVVGITLSRVDSTILTVDATTLNVDFHFKTKWSVIWLIEEWISTPLH